MWTELIQQACNPVRQPEKVQALSLDEEILAAARYQLREWTPDEIDAGLAAANSAQLHQNALQAIFGRYSPKDAAKAEKALQALKTLNAHAAEDWSTFYQAGVPLRDSYRQTQRAGSRRGVVDALSIRISAYLEEGITSPTEIWEDLCRIAEEGGDAVVDGYINGQLFFQAKTSDEELTPISYETFRRRVQRSVNKQGMG